MERVCNAPIQAHYYQSIQMMSAISDHNNLISKPRHSMYIIIIIIHKPGCMGIRSKVRAPNYGRFLITDVVFSYRLSDEWRVTNQPLDAYEPNNA